jgi:hypothetical protein
MAVSTASPTFPREVELRLLRCTLPAIASHPPLLPPPVHPLGAVAASALAAIELGDYAAALASAAPHILHDSVSTDAAHVSPAQLYADLAAAVEAFLRGDVGGAANEGFECRCALVLQLIPGEKTVQSYVSFDCFLSLFSRVAWPIGHPTEQTYMVWMSEPRTCPTGIPYRTSRRTSDTNSKASIDLQNKNEAHSRHP